MAPYLATLRYIRERADNTVAGYASDIAKFLTFCERTGLVYPRDVKPKHVQFFGAAQRQEMGLTKRTVARRLAALRDFFRFLIREELTDRNPAAHAYAPKAEQQPPRRLDIMEQDHLLDSA